MNRDCFLRQLGQESSLGSLVELVIRTENQGISLDCQNEIIARLGDFTISEVARSWTRFYFSPLSQVVEYTWKLLLSKGSLEDLFFVLKHFFYSFNEIVLPLVSRSVEMIESIDSMRQLYELMKFKSLSAAAIDLMASKLILLLGQGVVKAEDLEMLLCFYDWVFKDSNREPVLKKAVIDSITDKVALVDEETAKLVYRDLLKKTPVLSPLEECVLETYLSLIEREKHG